MLYQFETYDGKTIDYPVAAYAAVYANEWVVPSNTMEWIRQQSSPISYRSVIERFAQMTKGPTNIFHVEFRCMVQIVATIGNPISADILKYKIFLANLIPILIN